MGKFNRERYTEREESPRFESRGRPRFERREPRFERREGRRRDDGRPQMHSVVCDKCGERCEVPFKPTGDKPVYCSDCFRSNGPAEPRGRSSPSSSVDLSEINRKLDKIMRALKIE